MLKTKRFRRLLTVLLAVLMLSVSIPVAAFADDEAETAKHRPEKPSYTVTINCIDSDINTIATKEIKGVAKNADLWSVLESADMNVIGYEWDGAFYYNGNIVNSGSATVTDNITVVAGYTEQQVTRNLTVKFTCGGETTITINAKPGNEPKIVDVLAENSAQILEQAKTAANDDTVIITGYTDIDGNAISEETSLMADATVYAKVGHEDNSDSQKVTITIQRPGFSDVYITAARGAQLGDILGTDYVTERVLSGLPDDYYVQNYTYADPDESIITDVEVQGDLTVRAVLGSNNNVSTHTVTIDRGEGYDDVYITVEDGANLIEALSTEQVQKMILSGMPHHASVVGYTYTNGDDVIAQDIVTADTTVKAVFETRNTPVTHTVTIKRDGMADVVITVEDNANLLKALWDESTQKQVLMNMPESASVINYTFDREVGNVIDSYYAVQTDVVVRAYFSESTYTVTVKIDGYDDVAINVVEGTGLLAALNDESVKNTILASLPSDGFAIEGFTYTDGSKIIDQDVVMADVTVKAVLGLYHNVTVQRSNGAEDVVLSVKDGSNLLEALNAEENQAAIMAGCDGYKVTKYTYGDGSDVIAQDSVMADVTVVANMEAVPAEETPDQPTTPPTEGGETTTPPTEGGNTTTDNNSGNNNTTTVTSNSNDKKDSGEEVVKSTAAPADNTAKVLPQTGVQASAPIAAFVVVLAAALAGAACYLFVVRKKLN